MSFVYTVRPNPDVIDLGKLYIVRFNSFHPTFQLVPSEYTGTLVDPPPATVVPNVETEESVTNALDPTPAVDALGRVATVKGTLTFNC
jgi:hypothetical protein